MRGSSGRGAGFFTLERIALSDAEIGRTMSSGMGLDMSGRAGEISGLSLSMMMSSGRYGDSLLKWKSESFGFRISNSVPLWLIVSVGPPPREEGVVS